MKDRRRFLHNVFFLVIGAITIGLSFIPVPSDVGLYGYMPALGIAVFCVFVSLALLVSLPALRNYRFIAKVFCCLIVLGFGRFTIFLWAASWQGFFVIWALAAGFICYDFDKQKRNIALIPVVVAAAVLSAFYQTVVFGFSLIALAGIYHCILAKHSGERAMGFSIALFAFLSSVSFIDWMPQILLPLFVPCISLGYGCVVPLYHRAVDLKRENEELLRREIYLNDLEEKALRDEIRPHFLLNALNNVRVAYHDSPEEGKELLRRLIRLETLIAELSEDKYIPISKEIEIIDGLIRLFVAERKNEIRFDVDVEDDSLPIPPMLLEPLVENSLQHSGILSQEGGAVSIKQRTEYGIIVITVADNGVGSPLPSQSRGIGLSNVIKRVELLEQGHMDIYSDHTGTQIEIRFAA